MPQGDWAVARFSPLAQTASAPASVICSSRRSRATPQPRTTLRAATRRGDGVDRNREKALYWYGKAARQGDADAQARLEAF
ncbi:SEL1-like repeat protein [Desulfovibrio sp.]|uniref:SEL1-like repeat protein n=1 Tax=Desulfovibrio sp. TaxID=885 RepID=UPI00344C4736